MNIPNLLAAATIALVIVLLIIFAVLNLAIFLAGAPYVPSKRKIIYYALSQIKPRAGSVFIDLGCGDGFVVRHAARKYRVKGIGIDINPMLIWFAKILAFISGTAKTAKFKHGNLFKTNIAAADYIFVYLMPSMLENMGAEFVHKCKSGTIIISNAFPISRMRPLLKQTISQNNQTVFVYQIP